jgi:sulfite reductase alpha subunit-like flavoprotein
MLDILRECPSITITPENFLSLVPRQRPRYYSIASSNLVWTVRIDT